MTEFEFFAFVTMTGVVCCIAGYYGGLYQGLQRGISMILSLMDLLDANQAEESENANDIHRD